MKDVVLEKLSANAVLKNLIDTLLKIFCYSESDELSLESEEESDESESDDDLSPEPFLALESAIGWLPLPT